MCVALNVHTYIPSGDAKYQIEMSSGKRAVKADGTDVTADIPFAAVAVDGYRWMLAAVTADDCAAATAFAAAAAAAVVDDDEGDYTLQKCSKGGRQRIEINETIRPTP